MNVKKKLISSMLAAAMAFGTMSAFVSALETDTVETVQFTAVPESSLTNDESLELYLNSRLAKALDEGEESFYYSADYCRSQLSGYDLELYDLIKAEIVKISEGKTSSSEFTIEMTIPFSESYMPSGRITEIICLIMEDCPQELFWFDKTHSFGGSAAISPDYSGFHYSLSIRMPVSADYSATGEEGTMVTDIAKITAVNSSVDNAKAIIESYKGKTDSEKLVGYRDTICELTEYDHHAADNDIPYGDPWQLISVFDNDPSTNVVCEGYSKAFKFLCDHSSFNRNIECVTVSGYINGGHMWNIAVIDGTPYMADVTNCDSGLIGYPDKLFLKGMDEYESGRAYTITANGKTLLYQYDSDTINMYPESVLKVSSVDFDFSSPDPEPAPDEKKVSNFVERLYTKMLARPSEEAGKADWVNKLRGGATATDVASGFVLSEEIRVKNLSNEEFVSRMYRTFMDREPDAEGLADWVNALDNGCSYAYILNSFVLSAEFGNICKSYGIETGRYEITEARDKSRNLTAFTSRMYTKALGRAYEVEGLNYWTGRVLSGEATLDAMAHGFIFSAELNNKNLSNEEFVDTLYATFFDRPADESGKADWLGKLDRGECTREQVLDGFLGAQEFANLVESFGL